MKRCLGEAAGGDGGGTGTPVGGTEERAEKYDGVAHIHADLTLPERLAFKSAPVRVINNYVKACLLDVTLRALPADVRARGVDVADIAGGRGQDHSKTMFAARNAATHIARYDGLDLSKENTLLAQRMAQRYFRGASTRFVTGDMGDPAAWAAFPDASYDVVTCQLALHYLCKSRELVAGFFHHARRAVRAAGFVLVSFTDGRAVVRRARDCGGLVVQREHYTIRIADAASLARRVRSPFDHLYTFHLPGSVENVPEYLCHEGAVTALAAKAGLRVVHSVAFDVFARAMHRLGRFRKIAELMHFTDPGDAPALDAANLYRCVVLAPAESAAALSASWSTSMRD